MAKKTLGRAPKKNRERWRDVFWARAGRGTDCLRLYKACRPKLGWECDSIQDRCFEVGARRR